MHEVDSLSLVLYRRIKFFQILPNRITVANGKFTHIKHLLAALHFA
jgi:hypothetical protein